MCKFYVLSISFVLSEIVLAFAFAAIAQVYYKEIKGFEFKSIVKGSFERIFFNGGSNKQSSACANSF